MYAPVVYSSDPAQLEKAKVSGLYPRWWEFSTELPRKAAMVVHLEGGNIGSSGPREQANDGGLEGVFGDHQSRYKWAAEQVDSLDPEHPDTVLDCPCGTGYGSVFLGPISMYRGVDIDEAAVEFAKRHYHFPGLTGYFSTGSMLDLPYAAETMDWVVSFEGFEHVEDHERVLSEFHRVLRPGGRLLLSTPQKGVAPGTQWDKYMVGNLELVDLLKAGHFGGIEQFHQENYGVSCYVKSGSPSSTDLIQLVRVRKI